MANTLTGTANEVIVTNGAGTITLSTPQDIATSSDPTFHDLTVTHLNSKIANDLTTGPSSSLNGDLCSFNGTTGKVIMDSSIASADVFL